CPRGRGGGEAGAPGILLRYLQEQNRPYSAQDVFRNLQREHGLGKAAVVKALEQLAQQGRIREKTYGKQKIYFADQDQFDTVSDADFHRLHAKIVALTAKVQSLQQSCRHMEITPEMQREIQELRKECACYTERLKNIKAATNHVTPEEKEKVYSERQKYCKEWRKHKRMATELCDAILEGYPKSKKQFFEEVGIETDEDYKVMLPDPGGVPGGDWGLKYPGLAALFRLASCSCSSPPSSSIVGRKVQARILGRIQG
uniref:Homologous-pairing protein 2 homolog n=1 Tax=Jaculus jaculus TaxID=51337 RepID=A0A8C5JUC7_JACJA